MAKTIWKYEIPIETTLVDMPQGARLLSAAVLNAHRSISLWAEVDNDAPLSPVEIYVYGTGHRHSHAAAVRFVATVQDPPFVWHIYQGAQDD